MHTLPIVVRAVTEEEYQDWIRQKRDAAEQLAFLTEEEWTVDELLSQGWRNL